MYKLYRQHKMADKGFFGDLKGKVAFITGASGGIGAATAQEFAKQGVRLALHGRNVERLTKVQQQCVELGLKTEDVFMVTGELVKADDVKKMVADTLEYFGSVDILVNNAGSGTPGTLDSTTFETMDAMFHLHVKAPLQLVQLLKESITKNKGAIINVSSALGMIGAPFYLLYSIAKAAVIQLTVNLNIDLGPKGVRCNTVSPGALDNDFTVVGGIAANDEQKEKFMESLSKRVLAGRPGKSEEIANAILYLASDASSYMMGQNLVVDGGLTDARLINASHLLNA